MRMLSTVVLAMGLMLAMGCSGPEDGAASLNRAGEAYEAYTLPPLGDGPPIITMAEFTRLQVSMTRDEVIAIIGTDGTVVDEKESPAAVKIYTYRWLNDDRSEATVDFANNKVISKSQTGLK